MTPGFWRRVAVRGCLGLLLATPAVVVANDDLDVTMRMVRDNDDLTESVVREIELREPVALERRNGEADKADDIPGAARGVEKARDRGREAARTGAERAREVRERNEKRERPERPEPPGASKRPEKPELP